MKNMPLLTALFVSTLSAVFAQNAPTTPSTEQPAPIPSMQPYKPKDYSHLIGMPGFSDKSLNTHFKLYQGYVTNINLLLGIIQQYASEGKDRTPQYAEIKRRLGWEFDGMRLHELYFSNLGGQGTQLDPTTPLHKRIVEDFGSFEAWKKDFIATGVMRGIGWVILYLDPVQGRLINAWIGEHDIGHLAGGTLILVMDVWEHAYMVDYGLDRMDYIKAFFENINWNVIKNRYPKKND